MSAINNYYKTFECDERTNRLVERILKEYRPLLRWIRNRQNKYGEDFKEDLYQYTMYNVCLNVYNRVHKTDMTDDEVIKLAPMSIYRAYTTSVKNMPTNLKELREYPHSIDDDYDESGKMQPGHVLVPAKDDDNLERAGEPTLDELIESLPCNEELKTAILMLAQGYRNTEAAEAIGIAANALWARIKCFRESKKFKAWAKEKGIDFEKMMQL